MLLFHPGQDRSSPPILVSSRWIDSQAAGAALIAEQWCTLNMTSKKLAYQSGFGGCTAEEDPNTAKQHKEGHECADSHLNSYWFIQAHHDPCMHRCREPRLSDHRSRVGGGVCERRALRQTQGTSANSWCALIFSVYREPLLLRGSAWGTARGPEQPKGERGLQGNAEEALNSKPQQVA